jgi:hypothetical protein
VSFVVTTRWFFYILSVQYKYLKVSIHCLSLQVGFQKSKLHVGSVYQSARVLISRVQEGLKRGTVEVKILLLTI